MTSNLVRINIDSLCSQRHRRWIWYFKFRTWSFISGNSNTIKAISICFCIMCLRWDPYELHLISEAISRTSVEGNDLNLDTNRNHFANQMPKLWDIVYSSWKTVTTDVLHGWWTQFFIYVGGRDGWEKLLVQELRGYVFKIKLVCRWGILLCCCSCAAESHDFRGWMILWVLLTVINYKHILFVGLDWWYDYVDCI